MKPSKQNASFEQRFPRVPRSILQATDADFRWWKGLLKGNLRKRPDGDLLRAFGVYLHVAPPFAADWWRFANYASRNPGSQASTRKYPQGKYDVRSKEGFARFLANEPGKAFGRTVGAIIGFALLPPMGAFVGSGAVAGAQNAADNPEMSVFEGAVLGGIGGYGTGIQALAPLLSLTPAAPASGQLGKLGGGIAQIRPANAPPLLLESEKPLKMPEKYRRLQQALIEVESGGDPNAISSSGKFVGLLQMGPAAAKDVGIDDHKAALFGNASAAIDAFWEYQARYAKYTGGHPFMMAVLWKGGPGTAKKFGELLSAGAKPLQGLRQLESNIPNLVEYMRRTAAAY